MKAEHIHEALNLLPDDLIEKVDKLRAQQAIPRNRIWKHISAIAACLAILILGSFAVRTLSGGWGGSFGYTADSTASNFGEKDNAMSETATATGAAAPEVTAPETDAVSEESAITDCPGDPTAYAAAAQYVCTGIAEPCADHPPVVIFRSRQELEEYCGAAGLAPILDAAENYDEAYFAENDLILADLGQDSSSVTHEITGILPAGDHTWELQCLQNVSEDVTDDIVQWYALVEADKNLIRPGDTVTLSWTSETD